MKLGGPEFGIYIFSIVRVSWLIVLFISMKYPSLSLPVYFSFKSILWDSGIMVPACSLYHLLRMAFLSFLFKEVVVFEGQTSFMYTTRKMASFLTRSHHLCP